MPKKILVIQTAFIGDLIMSTPIFRALKEIEPDSIIDVVTIPQSSILLKYNPFVNKIHTFSKKQGLLKKSISFLSLVEQLKKEKYDLCISVQNSFTSSFFMLLAGIKIRIGNRTQKFVSNNVIIPKGLHNRQRVLELLKPLSTQKFSEQTEIFLSELEIQKANIEIKKNNSNLVKKIGISPGSVRETKKWLPEYFTELVGKLKSDTFHLYFFGSKEEKGLCQKIIDGSGNPNCFNYAGNLNLLESTALIEKMDLMLTNDSAALHIANAVKTDVYVFFGPTVKRFGCYPYRENDKIFEVELECRPCGKHGAKKCPLKHHNCMKLIKPEDVYSSIYEYFNNLY